MERQVSYLLVLFFTLDYKQKQNSFWNRQKD